MFVLELDCTREQFIRRWCRGEAQHDKAAAADKAGTPPGQHIEALRQELAWLKRRLSDDLREEIQAAIDAQANEGGDKP